jgi:hypothetical protein
LVKTNNVKTLDELIALIEKARDELGKNATAFESYSTLIDKVESYNDVLSQSSEYLVDNVTVTKEYKDSLTELGASEENLREQLIKIKEKMTK